MPMTDAFSLPECLVRLFAPGLDLESFRGRTAQILREAVGCAVVSFATFDPNTRKLDVVFDPFYPEIGAGFAGYGRHMAKYPCFNFDPSIAGGRPFLRSDFMDDAAFRASDIYREGFAVAGLTDHAAMLLPALEPEHVFFVGMERAAGTYRAEDRETLARLQPHLANAVQLVRALASLERAVADPAAFVRAGLSPRESEVLTWLARGRSNAEIGTILGVRLPTVKAHVKALFDKLGVGNRHAAVLRAHEIARRSVASEPNPAARRAWVRAASRAG